MPLRLRSGVFGKQSPGPRLVLHRDLGGVSVPLRLRSGVFWEDVPRTSSASKKLGRDERIRTSDPHTPSVMRYQAALHPDRLLWPQMRSGRDRAYRQLGELWQAGPHILSRPLVASKTSAISALRPGGGALLSFGIAARRAQFRPLSRVRVLTGAESKS